MIWRALTIAAHSDDLFGRLAAAGQILFALACLAAGKGLSNWAPARYCFYFFLLNWASAVAFTRFLRGQKQVLWQPRVG